VLFCACCRNDDDSIAVKPCSSVKCSLSNCTQNMLFEHMSMTGFGASIGSVPPDYPPRCVRNVSIVSSNLLLLMSVQRTCSHALPFAPLQITFRNISMPNTGKGVYVKSNPSCGIKPQYPGKPKTATISDIL